MALPTIQTSFNAGEISPELYGEVDLKKFTSAMTTARNGIVNYRGGFLSRAGLAFVGRCKQNPPNPPRPIPFQFNINQGYILEFGDNYIRFVYRGGYILEAAVTITGVTQSNPIVLNVAGTPYSVGDWVYITGVPGLPPYTYLVSSASAGQFTVTDLDGNVIDSTLFPPYVSGASAARIYTISSPYLAVDLPYLKFSQSADVMSLTCSNPVTSNEYPPYDLTRLAANNWTLIQTSFDSPIQAPANLAATPNSSIPPNGVPCTFNWVVTAVDAKGNESVQSNIASANGVDIQVEGGGYTLNWTFSAGAKFYNIYRSPPSIATYTVASNGVVTVSKWNPVPGGSIMGFVGSSYGTSFTDTSSAPDLQQTPPTHQNPFARGQILAVNVTSQGSGLTAISYTITTATGVNFAGFPLLDNGQLGGFAITNPGSLYQPGDSIAFNGAGFASGSILFGTANNPNANDTITLNGVVWTFVTTVTGSQQTLIGSSQALTLQNLIADLSASTNALLTVASYSGSIDTQSLLIQYKTAGTAGNSYTLAASRATPSGATLTGGSGSGFAGQAASGTLTFAANPTAGQTIILDGVTWTFVAAGATGNQTNIQGTTNATVAQLATDLTASANTSILLANYSATTNVLTITYKTVGTAGNSYTLNGGTSGATTSAATLTGGLQPSVGPAGTLTVGPETGTYPGVNTYFQQRHFFANSLNNPDTFWASQTGLYVNFDTSVPTVATDAITASPWSEQVNGIQWLVPMPGGLLALTGSRAWQILGGLGSVNTQAPITPSTVEAQPQAFNGCSPTVPPIVIDHEVIYLEVLQTVVRDLSWNFWVNIYTGADLTVLSSHLFLFRKILQWTWARNPYKVVWCACDDGTMLALTYLKEQEVYGWTRCDTQGLVVGTASVTEPPVNAPYFIVERFKPQSSGPPSPGSFVMQARENYDPATATQLGNSTPPNQCLTDPTNLACGFDIGAKSLTYLGLMVAGVDPNTTNYTNATGYTLFDGVNNVYANGATISVNNNFTPTIMRKAILTDVVTAFPMYSAAATVPVGVGSIYVYIGTGGGGSGYSSVSIGISGGGGSGMHITAILDAGGSGQVCNYCTDTWGTGYTSAPTLTVNGVGGDGHATIANTAFNTPSDGTYRWIGSDFQNVLGLPNGPGICNPHQTFGGNADFAICSESCELYVLRAQDNYAMNIAPAIIANAQASISTPVMVPFGVDGSWYYTMNFPGGSSISGAKLIFSLVPSTLQAAETQAAKKLTYVIWSSAPFAQDVSARLTFGNDGNVYVLSSFKSGSNKFQFRLTQYKPPAVGTFGSNAPGTMTDVTPWSTAQGPDLDGANYSITYTTPAYINMLFKLFRLPATGKLALVTTFPKEASSAPTDYTKTLISCTFVTLGNPSAFEHHSGFVTGYMTAGWAPTGSIPTTGWAVVDCRETDNVLEQSDYVYPGIDYTKRWLEFQCYPITSGTVQTGLGLYTIFVEYSFIPGAAPVVVSPPGILTDAEWDANYAAYQAAISQTYVVMNSRMTGTAATGSSNLASLYPDPMLSPTVTSDNSFWGSGLVDVIDFVNVAAVNNMFHLNAAFTSRTAYNANTTPQYHLGGVTPPLLRLTFGGTSMGPGVYMMERMDNRLWQDVEDIYAVDAGVSNPIETPAANLQASAASGNGVTFTADQNVFDANDVGQILRMSGGIATISAYTDTQHVTGNWILAASPGVIGVPYAANGDWTLATPVNILYAPWLEGTTVVGLADGVPIGPITVGPEPFGPITLPFLASNVKVGLSYVPQMQTPYLNGPDVVQGARKVIPAATFRLAASGVCAYGTNQPDGGSLSPQQIAPPWNANVSVQPLMATGGQLPPQSYTTPGGATAVQLWTGDIRVVGDGAGWVSKGQIALQQTLPLPLEVVAVLPEFLDGDTPERGYGQQAPGRGPPMRDEGQGQRGEPPQGFLRGGPRI